MSSDVDVDVVVIGSGAGGLAAAVSLARAGKSVLVCEQHQLPGGWCHSFDLGGFRFSPGVHYLGQLQEGGALRRLYEGLGLGPHLTFHELEPEGFDHIELGGERFSIPRGKQRYQERLQERFPHEREGIAGFLDGAEAIYQQLQGLDDLGFWDLLWLPWRVRSVLRWGWRSAETMLRHWVRDPVVRGILSGQCGDHGLAPSQVSAAVHAAITAYYFDGAWYPEGGGRSLPRAHLRVLKEYGGEIRVGTPVTSLLLERGRVLGVRLGDGSEVRAEAVVSNADPGVTFGRLLPREALGPRLRSKLEATRYSTSCFSLFMASEMDPAEYGLDSGNVWLYRDHQVDALYREGEDFPRGGESRVPVLFLTVTTLKDPSKDYAGVHTMEAFTFGSYAAVQDWAGSRSGERPEGYEKVKEEIREAMLATLEARFPGFREKLVFCELGTPLTNEHYCGATRGNLYGNAKIASQVGPFSFPLQSAFPGLYLCGASTLSHGVAGAAQSGVAAAATLLGCSPAEFMDPAPEPLTLVSR